ncbi:tetratricopeptide repeat protein [bacterium]|nr:MAG: tetratricopeptide repeat protein [bacterium]
MTDSIKAIPVHGLLILFSLNSAALAQSEIEQGRELFNNKKYAEARSIFEKILNGSDHQAEAHYYLGSIYLRFDRDADKAIDHLERAIEAENSNAKYHLMLSNALGAKAMQSNMLKQAFLAPKIKKAMEKAVELDPNYPEARMALTQFYVMAPGIMGGSIEKAKEQADALVKLDAYQGFMAYGSIYNHEEDWQSAEVYFKKAIAAQPLKAAPYHQLGYMYLKQKRTKEAVELFKKMVEYDPANANSYDSLGDGYVADNKLDDAIDAYKKAVSVDPKFGPSVFNLAKCYEKKNMKKEAKDNYKRYLALVPTGSQADEARSKLDE